MLEENVSGDWIRQTIKLADLSAEDCLLTFQDVRLFAIDDIASRIVFYDDSRRAVIIGRETAAVLVAGGFSSWLRLFERTLATSPGLTVIPLSDPDFLAGMRVLGKESGDRVFDLLLEMERLIEVAARANFHTSDARTVMAADFQRIKRQVEEVNGFTARIHSLYDLLEGAIAG